MQKERVGEMGSSNLQKNSKFKALPLPRFYKKKKDSPPKSETKKVSYIKLLFPIYAQIS